MTKIGRSILLGADIEIIYDILTDAQQIPEWFEHISKLDAKDDFPQPGGKADITFVHGDVVLKYSMTCKDFVEGEYGIFELDGDLVGIQRWTTRPERGGYRLSIDYEYDLPSKGLSKFVERITRDTLAKSLYNLKSRVETKTVDPYF